MAESVIAVVGARLNSSRLPGKHLLPLAGKPLIERLFERLSMVSRLSDIVLATTNDTYNAPLAEWASSAGMECYRHAGDVNDLVGRIDAVVQGHGADIILYVCGDCPLVEPETIDRMLDVILADKEVENVQLPTSNDDRKWIHEGFDIYRRPFWDSMVSVAHEPFEREHIGAVYHSLGKVQPKRVGYVDEPDVYRTVNHRISVDTPSDYEFMVNIYEEWHASSAQDVIVDLRQVIHRLQEEGGLRAINQHVRQKGVHDSSSKVTIFTEAGAAIGLGHLMRMIAAIRALQDHLSARVELIIKGEPVSHSALQFIDARWVTEFKPEELAHALETSSCCVFDVKKYCSLLIDALTERPEASVAVGIDVAADFDQLFDLVWMPSIFLDNARVQTGGTAISHGWDCFLLHGDTIKKGSVAYSEQSAQKVLVLTGGSDAANMGDSLPDMLLSQLPGEASITWVEGPYASAPVVTSEHGKHRFSVEKAPNNLTSLYSSFDVILAVYGVSYYECLKAGVPTIVFDPVGAAAPEEWELVRASFPGFVADNVPEAISKLRAFIDKPTKPEEFDRVSRQLAQGGENFASTIGKYIERASLPKAIGA